MFYTLILSSFFSNIYFSQNYSDISDMKDLSAYMNINNKNRKKSPVEIQQSIKFNLKTLLNLKVITKSEQNIKSDISASLKKHYRHDS